MASCEKCWRDAGEAVFMTDGDQVVAYARLIGERDRAGHPCTPEEQAGPYATECAVCGRQACHQHCRCCMACGAGEAEAYRQATEPVGG